MWGGEDSHPIARMSHQLFAQQAVQDHPTQSPFNYGPPPTAPARPKPKRWVSSVLSEITEESTDLPFAFGDALHEGQSVPLAQLAGEGRTPSEPVIPLADTAPASCEKCGDVVEGGYSNRRAHVYANHPPVESAITLETQEALKKAMGQCFPASTIRNDLTCNYAGCWREVTIYASCTALRLQRLHIQQHHLGAIDEENSPLRCPVRECIKWRGTRRDEETLRLHIQKTHKSMSDADSMACNELHQRLKSVAEKYLSSFFPHTPKGYLRLGGNFNMTRGVKKAVRNDALQPRPSAKVMGDGKPRAAEEPEPSETECRECGEMIPSAYLKRREHVVGTHMEHGEMEDGTVADQQDTLKMAMTRCFPTATVLNDLACNYAGCGAEVQHMGGRTVSQLQNWHIQKYHLSSVVGEKIQITCPVDGCTKMQYAMPHMDALSQHLYYCHSGVGGLAPAEQKVYSQIQDRVGKATKELFPRCFLRTPRGYHNSTSSQYRKRKARPNDEEIYQSIFLNHY